MSNFKQRLAFGSLASIFFILVIWFSPYAVFSPIFTLIISTCVTLAVSELFQIAKKKNYQPLTKIGITGCFTYILSIYLSLHYPWAKTLPYIILFLILFSSFIYFFFYGTSPLGNLSLTFFAFGYLVLPLSTWLYIAYFFPNGAVQEGRWWLLYLMAVTKLTDIGAYFTGSVFGRHKMTPYISPGKSWEGAIGGLTFGVIASYIFFLFGSYIPLQLTGFQCIILGLLLSFMGQMGDLAESLIKRDAGVKNSSQIPGLGGILDILDSLVFTSPILYIFLKTWGESI